MRITQVIETTKPITIAKLQKFDADQKSKELKKLTKSKSTLIHSEKFKSMVKDLLVKGINSNSYNKKLDAGIRNWAIGIIMNSDQAAMYDGYRLYQDIDTEATPAQTTMSNGITINDNMVEATFYYDGNEYTKTFRIYKNSFR